MREIIIYYIYVITNHVEVCVISCTSKKISFKSIESIFISHLMNLR
jgi:hypothetical protein